MDGLHRVVLGFGSRMRIPIEMGTKDAVDLITGQPKKKNTVTVSKLAAHLTVGVLWGD